MAFNPSLKGLLTEVTPQSAGEDTLLDVSDMIISQTDKLESRHGVNIQTIANLSSYNATNANVSVFKIPFSSAFATSSGFTTKYVLLSGGNSSQQELVTPSTFVGLSLSATSALPTVYTQKPLGFTFDQSFYVVGANGWQEMQTDVLDSGATGVKKIISWPKFYNLSGRVTTDNTFLYNNWLSPGFKVGIRYTFVRETSYNENSSRLIESDPSAIQEIPYIQNTSNFSSSILSAKGYIVYTINNFFTDFTTNINNRKYYLRLYRTKAVPVTETLPTEYFQTYEDILITSAVVFTDVKLTINDVALITLPQLYTNPNLDGEANKSLLPPIANKVVEYKNYHVAADIREPLRATITLITPPFYKSIQAFKQLATSASSNTSNTFSIDTSLFTTSDMGSDTYKVYSFFHKNGDTLSSFGNGIDAMVTSNNTSYGTTTGTTASAFRTYFSAAIAQTNASITLRLTAFDNSVTTFGPIAVTPAFNNPGYYETAARNYAALDYSGETWNATTKLSSFATIRKTPYTSNLQNFNSNLKLNMVDGNTFGQVKSSIKALASGTVTFGTDNIICAIGSATDGNVDIGAFDSPGMALIVSGASDYYLFSYKTTSIPAANQLKFENTSKISASATPTISATSYSVYVIPGSQANSLPLYLQNLATAGTFTLNLTAETLTSVPTLAVSLLPVTGKYPEVIADADGRTLSNAITTGTIEATLFGNTAFSPAQLIDNTASEIVNTANGLFTLDPDIRFYKTENVGEFVIEYYGGKKIEALITGGTHKYEPALTTSYQTIAEYKQNNIRAVSVSRYNAPESFPAAQVLAPILVGSDKKKIVALTKNSNDCFVLKEDGIWRLTISGNTSLPFVEEVQQIDTTTFCQAPYSVQEINEEIIFLSQKGFISIAGNSISNLGRNIETEVKSKLQRSIQKGLAGQIRSWVNEEKRIYGCTIPDSTVTFTTYVFNTYTREWTKFSLPIIDASTDSEGRTTYLVGQYAVTMDASGTLQEQINNSSSGTLVNYTLTEEIHTDGQNRNELDQWDYWYKPASAVDNGNGTATLTDQLSLAPWSRLGGSEADITQSGLAYFVDKQAYYIKSGVLYPATFVSRTATTVTVAFADGVPSGISTIGASDGLYAGVGASVTFNPSSVGTPDTNKQFSEYMVHVDEAVSGLSMKFKTDSQASFSATREFAFVTNAPNRTVYRTYIPISASRGRWFIRQVNHSIPYERLVITGQTLNIRDTNSSRVQKQQT